MVLYKHWSDQGCLELIERKVLHNVIPLLAVSGQTGKKISLSKFSGQLLKDTTRRQHYKVKLDHALKTCNTISWELGTFTFGWFEWIVRSYSVITFAGLWWREVLQYSFCLTCFIVQQIRNTLIVMHFHSHQSGNFDAWPKSVIWRDMSIFNVANFFFYINKEILLIHCPKCQSICKI